MKKFLDFLICLVVSPSLFLGSNQIHVEASKTDFPANRNLVQKTNKKKSQFKNVEGFKTKFDSSKPVDDFISKFDYYKKTILLLRSLSQMSWKRMQSKKTC